MYHKKLEIEELTKSKPSKGEKIIKIQVEDNEIENNREKSMKSKLVP